MFFDLFFFVLAFLMSIPLVGAWYASSRGKNFWLWYFIGLFLPVISFVILLCLPDEKNPIEKELQQIRINQKMLGLKNETPDNNPTFLKWIKKQNNQILFTINSTHMDSKRIHVTIDDVPLEERLSQFDGKVGRFLKRTPKQMNYIGLLPVMILPPSKHLIGKPQNQIPNRAVILREIEDDTMILVKVEVLRKYIIWHDFIKAKGTMQVKEYSKMGPFVFDRWQYELALNDLKYRYEKIS